MVTGIHGVQEITFNPLAKPRNEDYGLLYIGIGDGGAVEEGFPFIAHSKEKIWGTVIRIDPADRNSANRQYGIPSHNPFVKEQNYNTLKEIYAYEKTLKELCGSDRVDLHFGRDSKGELYILTKADGKVYKLVSEKKS